MNARFIMLACFIEVVGIGASKSYASGPIYYTVNSGATMQLDINPIADVFVGDITLSAGFCSIDCTMQVVGGITDSVGGETEFSFMMPSLTGSVLCSSVSFATGLWEGSVSHPDIVTSASFDISNFNVVSVCGSCGNTTGITFDSSNGSSISFAGPINPIGPCSIVCNLHPVNYYLFSH